MKSFFKRYVFVILSSIVAVALLVLGLYLFNYRTERIVTNVAENFTSEKAESIGKAISNKLSGDLRALNGSLELYESINLKNLAEIKNTLVLSRGVGSFRTIMVATLEGDAVDNDGFFWGNVSSETFFKKAVEGEAYISDLLTIPNYPADIIVAAFPIMRSNRVAAVCCGVWDRNVFTDILDSSAGQSNSVSFLLTKTGSVLASSDRKANLSSLGDTGYFAVEGDWKTRGSAIPFERTRIFDREETVFFKYNVEGDEKFTVITPVEGFEWVLAVVLPDDAIDRELKPMAGYITLLILCIAVSFALVLFAIVMLIRSDLGTVKRNENFALASLQNQIVVFDYDHVKKRLELAGNYDLIVGNRNPVFGEGEERELLNRIHDEDKAVRDMILSAGGQLDTQINAEARILCEDGEYHWFKMKANIVRGLEGRVKGLVGNLTNVDEHFNEAQELKHKAEIDPLTGLLNKGAFSALVQKKLDEAGEGSVYALYMIDIDNFKTVNDTLGHAIGDKVIADVATKIGLVFSDRDCIGRIGGDEFSVLLLLSPDSRHAGQRIVEDKAYRLCKRMDEVYSDGVNEVHVSLSVGVSCFPQDGETYEELYRRADAALYAAKHSGKNQSCIYRSGV
ncbi:MAG: diguanylate cyclase [Lachnospiraceae bacterium]|nr:diguanylate cyclase [Lachnospiraceae bacterium]